MSDIWSLGITLYAFTFFELPWYTPDDDEKIELYKKIRASSKIDFPTKRPISNQLKDLIEAMLKVDTKARITMKDIIKHQFIAIHEDS